MATQKELDEAKESLAKVIEGKERGDKEKLVGVDARAVFIAASSVKTPTQRSIDLKKGTNPAGLTEGQLKRWHEQGQARQVFIKLDDVFHLLEEARELTADGKAVIPE